MQYDLNTDPDSFRIPSQPDYRFVLDDRIKSVRIYLSLAGGAIRPDGDGICTNWLAIMDSMQKHFLLIGYASDNGEYPISGSYSFGLYEMESIFSFLNDNGFNKKFGHPREDDGGRFGLLYAKGSNA